MRLKMTSEDYATMVAHARAWAPEEACGLLGGEVDGRVRALYRVENLRHSAVEYEMNPEEQIRVLLEIEARGWELLGIFHSHPAGPPMPSPTDVRRAYYPDSAYVICAPDAAGQWSARAFRIDGGRVEEMDLQVGSG